MRLEVFALLRDIVGYYDEAEYDMFKLFWTLVRDFFALKIIRHSEISEVYEVRFWQQVVIFVNYKIIL